MWNRSADTKKEGEEEKEELAIFHKLNFHVHIDNGNFLKTSISDVCFNVNCEIEKEKLSLQFAYQSIAIWVKVFILCILIDQLRPTESSAATKKKRRKSKGKVILISSSDWAICVEGRKKNPLLRFSDFTPLIRFPMSAHRFFCLPIYYLPYSYCWCFVRMPLATVR